MKEKTLNEVQLTLILESIRKLKIEHPKAHVVYDTERENVYIFYPLPKPTLNDVKRLGELL